MLGQTMSDQTMIRENSSSDKFSANDSRRDVFEPGPSKNLCAKHTGDWIRVQERSGRS